MRNEDQEFGSQGRLHLYLSFMHIRGLAVSRLLINFMVEMQQTEPTEVEVVVMTRTVEMEWSKFSCVTGHDSGHFEWSLLPAARRKS